MRDVKEYREVLLAALLHDIGKFYGRSEEIKSDLRQYGKEKDVDVPHPALSGLFVDRLKEQIEAVGLSYETVKTLVEHHHESHHFSDDYNVKGVADPRLRALSSLVSKADNYSSKERDDSDSNQYGKHGNYFTSPIDSIFYRVDLSGADRSKQDDSAKKIEKLQHRPNSLFESIADGNIFPTKVDELSKNQLNKFVQEFGQKVSKINTN